MANLLHQIALWCTSCKFSEKGGGEEPCAACLRIAANIDTTKPIYYKKKEEA